MHKKNTYFLSDSYEILTMIVYLQLHIFSELNTKKNAAIHFT